MDRLLMDRLSMDQLSMDQLSVDRRWRARSSQRVWSLGETRSREPPARLRPARWSYYLSPGGSDGHGESLGRLYRPRRVGIQQKRVVYRQFCMSYVRMVGLVVKRPTTLRLPHAQIATTHHTRHTAPAALRFEHRGERDRGSRLI